MRVTLRTWAVWAREKTSSLSSASADVSLRVFSAFAIFVCASVRFLICFFAALTSSAPPLLVQKGGDGETG